MKMEDFYFPFKTKPKKKPKEEEEVWKWWEEKPHPEGIKWVTLEHNVCYLNSFLLHLLQSVCFLLLLACGYFCYAQLLPHSQYLLIIIYLFAKSALRALCLMYTCTLSYVMTHWSRKLRLDLAKI